MELQWRREDYDGLSVFGNCPQATPKEIAQAIFRLKACFPKMEEKTGGMEEGFSFWTELSNAIWRRRISGKRLQYMCDEIIEKFTYSDRLTIADVLKVDKKITILSNTQMAALEIPHPPLALAKIGDVWKICYKEDAELAGLEHKPYKSNAELRMYGEL